MDEALCNAIAKELYNVYLTKQEDINYGYIKKQIILNYYEKNEEELTEAIRRYQRKGACLTHGMPTNCYTHSDCKVCHETAINRVLTQINRIQER